MKDPDIPQRENPDYRAWNPVVAVILWSLLIPIAIAVAAVITVLK